MCGIAGVLDLKWNDAIIDKMLLTMSRRGPDGWGSYSEKNCCLLHSRLAVIDPTRGQQPMILQRGQETYTIVYNGELYNTEAIRKDLIHLGHTFYTHTDTEVVLHAYAQWSAGCLEHFNGIFAFAIWESNSKQLFLARDRMGVKPLFYMMHKTGMLFASEMKTILTYPDVKAQIDKEGLSEIILLGPGRTPGCGVFKNIVELEPGCCGYYKTGKFLWHRYWQLKDRIHTENFAETAEEVKFLVTDAICKQMVSDVPLGTFLSGGLDSSIISAVCAQEKAKYNKQLKTFSVCYENNDKFFVSSKFQPNADDDFIEIMASHLHTKHKLTTLTSQQLVDALEESTIARDLPGMADVDFSLLAFCKEIRKDVTVALSGECADEIFGGYPWYRDPDVRSTEGFPWSQNIKERVSFVQEGIFNKTEATDYVHDKCMQTIAQCDILPENSSLERRMKEMVNLNQRWFMQTLLDRKDRMSMYNSLEVRVPFCDHRIAEYLYGVPWEYKDYNAQEKGLLRYAIGDILPDAIRNRKKSPYPKTYHPEYLELVSTRLRHIIYDKNAPIHAIIRKEKLEELLTAQYEWPWYGQLMRVPQTIAYMLQVNYWLTYYNVDILI